MLREKAGRQHNYEYFIRSYSTVDLRLNTESRPSDCLFIHSFIYSFCQKIGNEMAQQASGNCSFNYVFRKLLQGCIV